MTKIFIISNIFTNLVFVLSQYIIMTAILNKSNSSKMNITIGYLIYYFTITYAFLCINIPIITLLANIIGLLLLTKFYESSLSKKILAVIATYTIGVLVETLIVLIFYNKNFMMFTPNEFNSISAVILIKAITFILALQIRKYFSVNEQVEIPKIYNNILISIELGSLILMGIIIVKFGDGGIYTILMLGLILIFNVFIFYIYNGITKLVGVTAAQQAMLNNQELVESQIMQMNDTLKEVRRIEHDMKNKLTPLYGMVLMGQSEDAAGYLNEMLQNFPTKKLEAKSGIVELDAILNYKIQRAKELGIDIKVKLLIPNDIKISGMDIAVIMGNLLDNAIEATSKAEDKWIKVCLKYIKGLVRLDIKNSYNGILKVKGDRLLTVKENPELHGMGIDNAKRLLEKYDGELDLYYDEKEFHVVGSFFA